MGGGNHMRKYGSSLSSNHFYVESYFTVVKRAK